MCYGISDMSNGHNGTVFRVLYPKISTGQEKLAPTGRHGRHVFATLVKKPHLFRLNKQFLDKISSHGGGSPKSVFVNKKCQLRDGGTPLAAENHCNALFGFYNPSAIHIIIYGGFLSNPAVILLPTRMSRDVAL